MKIAVIPDTRTTDCYAHGWTNRLRQMGVAVETVDAEDPELLPRVAGADGVMWRHAHIPHDTIKARRILGALEHGLGMPIYPDLKTCWHFDDKIAQYYLLRSNGFPAVTSYVFWDKKTALAWVRTASFPKVFKLASGAGSSNVRNVHSRKDAHRLVTRMFDRGVFPQTFSRRRRSLHRRANALLRRLRRGTSYVLTGTYPPLPMDWWQPEKGYAYFQDFLDGNDYDTRVTVIGDRAFAFRRFNRTGDFRASGSGKLDHDPGAVDRRFVELAFAITKTLSFQCMAYDFLYDNGEPSVVEMSYAFLNTAVARCPGHWDSALGWHEGPMAPEDAQVKDFIASIAAGKKHGRNAAKAVPEKRAGG